MLASPANKSLKILASAPISNNVHGFEWQSTFGTGQIPAYTVWDFQLNYPFSVNTSDLMIRVGCSNVLNQKRREIFGGPMIGRMIYTTLGFNLDRKKS